MKTIILLTAVFAFGAHAQTKSEFCAAYARTIENIAEARDNRVPLDEIISIINSSKVGNAQKELLSKTTSVIYDTPQYSREQAYRDSFYGCINSNSKGL